MMEYIRKRTSSAADQIMSSQNLTPRNVADLSVKSLNFQVGLMTLYL